MTDITELAQGRLDFTQPLETESGEPVKYVCHDVIEYKSARVCVDVETGIVYSSPHVGLKIRNVSKYTAVRKFTEEAAQACHEHDQGWISDMKCGDRSHQYLSFVRDPKNILALVEALEKAQETIAFQQGEIKALLSSLESRTVTVKLPDDGMDDCYEAWGPGHCRDTFDCGYNFSAMRHEEAFKSACATAGIKLEVE